MFPKCERLSVLIVGCFGANKCKHVSTVGREVAAPSRRNQRTSALTVWSPGSRHATGLLSWLVATKRIVAYIAKCANNATLLKLPWNEVSRQAANALGYVLGTFQLTWSECDPSQYLPFGAKLSNWEECWCGCGWCAGQLSATSVVTVCAQVAPASGGPGNCTGPTGAGYPPTAR